MKRFIKLIKKHNHFLYLLIFIPLILWFFIGAKSITPVYYMYCSIDDSIPFRKIFVIPYMFWFAYMIVAFLYLGLKSKRDFLKLLIFIFLGMSISFSVFIIYPTGQGLRPLLESQGAFSNLVSFIYYVDPPINVCPSIHVLNSIGVHLAISNYDGAKGKIKIFSFIIMILICISTVFIKQHSFIDVIWGSILAVVLYICVYVVPNLFTVDAKGNSKNNF